MFTIRKILIAASDLRTDRTTVSWERAVGGKGQKGFFKGFFNFNGNPFTFKVELEIKEKY